MKHPGEFQKSFYLDELKLNPSNFLVVENYLKRKHLPSNNNNNNNNTKDPKPFNEFIWAEKLTKINEIAAEDEEIDDKINVWRERLEIPNFWKIFNGVNFTRRIIWIICFIISFGLFIYETVDRIEKLIDPPKSSTVKLVYERELEFPLMTICPSYKFRNSILQKLKVDRYGCKKGEKYCSWDIPYNLATHTETTIKYCRFKKKNCSPGTEGHIGKWQRTMTSLGRCFTFHSYESIKVAGDSNSFEVIVDPLLWDSFGEATGIRVYIYGRDEVPLAEINGININPGSNANFALQVKEFNRVNDLRRNPCELNRNHSQSKCILGCMYDLVREVANTTCGAPFMQTFDVKACVVREEIVHLVSTFYSVINNGSGWNKCNQKCSEPCLQRTYTPISTSLGFSHSNNSYVAFTIYFSDMWVEQIIEKWDYDLEDFISDTGGSLNLFLGASFVSIIQITFCYWWLIGERIYCKR